MNLRKDSVVIVDAAIVLLNICSPYTLLPCFLFTGRQGINSLIIAGITIIYIFIRFKHIRRPKDIAFIIFLLLFGFNLVVAFSQGTLAVGFVAIYVANIVFFYFLYNIYYDYRSKNNSRDSLLNVSRGYFWLCTYQLIIIALMLVMTDGLHLFNPLQNSLNYKYDILFDNVDHLGANYYFPLHLSVLSTGGEEKLPFFHQYGCFLGVFHEPHTMTFFVTPFLFLCHGLGLDKKRLILIDALFVLYILVAASVTNIVCTVFVLSVWLCLKYKKAIIIIFPAIIFVSLYIWTNSDNPIIQLIQFKSESGSASYSSDTLSFAFTPKTFWGTNFLDLSYVNNLQYAKADVGFVVFTFNMAFLIVMIYRIIRLCLSSDVFYRSVGLFGLYFFCHASKLALRTYSLEMLMFVMLIVVISYRECYYNGKCKA